MGRERRSLINFGPMATQEQGSKAMQAIVTFSFGGAVAFALWPRLDQTSKALIMVFAVLAGLSIQNGTWMSNARDLRRAQRDERRQLIGKASNYVFGGGETKKD